MGKTGRDALLLRALAAQPGCPTEFRALALAVCEGPIIDAHCQITGDDPQTLIAGLVDVIERDAEADDRFRTWERGYAR